MPPCDCFMAADTTGGGATLDLHEPRVQGGPEPDGDGHMQRLPWETGRRRRVCSEPKAPNVSQGVHFFIERTLGTDIKEIGRVCASAQVMLHWRTGHLCAPAHVGTP